MAERPRLIDYIFDDNLREEVLERFPAPYLENYEIGLHKVKRWGRSSPIEYGDMSYLPMREDFKESDLEHTCDMLLMVQEIRERYEHLPKEINLREVIYMAGMHDAGEIIVKDAPAFGALRELPFWKRRKDLEPKAALRKIISMVPDPEVRGEMSGLYHRFIDQKPNDREAILTRLLDKTQGTTRVGVDNVFDYKAAGLTEPGHQLFEHVNTTLDVVVGATISLARSVSPKARAEVLHFGRGEIGRFNRIGFEGLAKAKQDNLFWALSRRIPTQYPPAVIKHD